MRSASSYRSAKKKAAKAAGVPFSQFNEHYRRSRHFAAAEIERKALGLSPAAAQKVLDVLGGDQPVTPSTAEERLQARRRLAEWAKNGGRATAMSPAVTQAELDAMNAQQPITQVQADAAAEQAKKLTPEDIDAALEKALTRWQYEAKRTDPMPLSRLFAARARQLGWAEGVEFVEAVVE